MEYNTQGRPLDVVQAKRILRQVAIMACRYGLGSDSVELLQKALDAGFYDNNAVSGLIFCLADDRKCDEALQLYKEAEQRIGGPEKAPGVYMAAIYAYIADRQPGKALQMINHFQETCVSRLKEDVRHHYVDFLDCMKEQL